LKAEEAEMSQFTWHFPDLRNQPGLPNPDEILLQIQQWHVREGDRVEVNQSLVTLETEEKDISLTIDSPVKGTIKSLHLTIGQTAHTGVVLAIFELED
jgi:acetyl/propionyl-CoA carboxylase alpha subunit